MMTSEATQEINALDAELDQFISLLSSFSHAQLNRKESNGGWSAMQCIHHLMLAESGSQQYVQKKLSFEPKLKDYSKIQEWGRRFLLVNYLKTSLKVDAPKYLTGEFLPAESDFTTTIAAWKAQRLDLRNYLSSLDETLYRKALMKHPLAGRISLTTMLAFFRAHLQRHQRQALRVLNEVV